MLKEDVLGVRNATHSSGQLKKASGSQFGTRDGAGWGVCKNIV